MHTQPIRVVERAIDLADVLNGFGDISRALAKKPRKHRLQPEKNFAASHQIC